MAFKKTLKRIKNVSLRNSLNQKQELYLRLKIITKL